MTKQSALLLVLLFVVAPVLATVATKETSGTDKYVKAVPIGPTYTIDPSTGACPTGDELTESQCASLQGQVVGGFLVHYGRGGTWSNPESCGCYYDPYWGYVYFNRRTTDCDQPESGEISICQVTSASNCDVANNEKVDCGHVGTTEAACHQSGCCWAEASGATPWCFKSGSSPSPPAPTPPPTPNPDCSAIVSRTDCGWSGVTQDQCESKSCCWVPAQTAGEPWCFYNGPAPTPAPPGPAPQYSDQDLINEFNDHNMGVAFSMISVSSWQDPTGGHGNNHMDNCGFYPPVPTQYHGESQQAMSIVTQKQDMYPYSAYGTPYGVVFHITEKSQFWKYFQVSWNGAYICGQPGDGFKCAPNGGARRPMEAMGKSYEFFTSQKNAILALFNTFYGNHDYNEFDTNGLSPVDLAGVFQNDAWYHGWVPSQQQMCNFLKNAYPGRKTKWPIYGYSWHSLVIKGYLPCGGEETDKVMEVNSTIVV